MCFRDIQSNRTSAITQTYYYLSDSAKQVLPLAVALKGGTIEVNLEHCSYVVLEKHAVMNEQVIPIDERLAANLAQVRSSIERAAQHSGRSPQEITLIAVSKTVSLEAVKIAYNLGVTDFGENRVQDALPKIAEFHPQDMRWHMIGHLQSNKASKVVGAFDSVQSVDNLRLAQVLSRHAEEHGKRLPVLLQVNVA